MLADMSEKERKVETKNLTNPYEPRRTSAPWQKPISPGKRSPWPRRA